MGGKVEITMEKEITPEVRVFLDKLCKDMENALTPYIFEKNEANTRLHMEKSLNEIFHKFAPSRDSLKDHIVVETSLQDPNKILFMPRDDAPDWVWDIFRAMKGDMFVLDFIINEDGNVTIN